ncbi:hypothetical protein HBA54_03110 [Pelagibius litoralis]|uniref:Tat (Twin-arginine translocation) pathway signal sequence n=1 Tax=Pelagibius litoralis TaxID=374515 RepID=A0A967C556_9PROT|nr:hypothetical protein [Pelagibius litoralis]NIA67571.1 hypothetical protein [Pelagibius litoralis]
MKTDITRRYALGFAAGAAAVSVSASVPVIAYTGEGMSPRLAELFTDWQQKWAAFQNCEKVVYAAIDSKTDCEADHARLEATWENHYAAFILVIDEPTVTTADAAAKAYAMRINYDLVEMPEYPGVLALLKDIERLGGVS